MGFSLLFLILTCSFVAPSASRSLKLVHVMYRHGDRAAIGSYPTDPLKSNIWPNGLGELTELGIQMEYELGRFLRQRYMLDRSFMNTSYLGSEVYIRSSTTDRCVVSALSQLAGMYPPSGHQVWNKDVKWQPIPVHSAPTAEDMMFEMDEVNCPTLKKANADWRRSPLYVALQIANQEFLHNLSVDSGLHISELRDIWTLADTLYTEHFHNFTLPKWATVIYEKLITLRDTLFIRKHAGSPVRSSLTAGVLLYDIVSHLRTFTERHEEPLKKMYIYSGALYCRHTLSQRLPSSAIQSANRIMQSTVSFGRLLENHKSFCHC